MLNVEKIAKCANSAKLEIDIASRYLKREVYDVQYVLTMLAEAKKQLDAITDIYCK